RRPDQHAKFGGGVNAAAPNAPTEPIEIFRMFACEQRLSLAIAMLLLQISVNRGAAIMPHKRCRAETNPVSGLLQAPAEIHIIARLAENGIEAANPCQCPLIKCHVAARNVFGLSVGQHYMGGTARRSHDSRSNSRIVWRQQIGTTDPGEAAL